MRVRAQWSVVAVLGMGLAAMAGQTVQPAQGPPPDQAVQPDLSLQIPAGQQEKFPEPVVEPVEPAAVPAAAAHAPAPVSVAPAEAVVPAATEQGRKLQQQTATLLQLARELKVELDKAGANTLSLAALHRADEIQKMAKDLKEEMGGAGK